VTLKLKFIIIRSIAIMSPHCRRRHRYRQHAAAVYLCENTDPFIHSYIFVELSLPTLYLVSKLDTHLDLKRQQTSCHEYSRTRYIHDVP